MNWGKLGVNLSVINGGLVGLRFWSGWMGGNWE